MLSQLKKITILVMALNFAPIKGQVNMTAYSISTAGTYMTKARSSNVFGWNPANLGFYDNPNFSFRFAPNIGLMNNSISPSLLNNYLLSGEHLSGSRKQEFIDAFHSDGLSLAPLVRGQLLGLSYRNFAFSVDAEVSGEVVIPKSLIETLFNGNEFGETLELNELNADLQAVVPISLGYGMEITHPVLNEIADSWYAGGALKLLYGIANIHTENVSGNITSYQDSLTLDADIQVKNSFGGLGFAFDMGIVAKQVDMTFAFSLNNIFGSINWSDDNSILTDYHIVVNTDTVDLLDSADVENLMDNAVKSDTSYNIKGYSTSYPMVALFGFQYDWKHNLTLFANYRQMFTDDLNFSKIPRLSGGVEYFVKDWFPIRLGLALGGKENFQWGTGFSFKSNHYVMDFGFSQNGGIFNYAKGFAFSLSHTIIF
tara:strand:- start:1434 stop:2714 length:1281 start_codon:yes stop_codon:yes gene_type:complete